MVKPPKTCPWPNKHRHPDKAAATRHINALWSAGRGSPDMEAYACGDHWHVGHSARKFRARIKRATRRRPLNRSRKNRSTR